MYSDELIQILLVATYKNNGQPVPLMMPDGSPIFALHTKMPLSGQPVVYISDEDVSLPTYEVIGDGAFEITGDRLKYHLQNSDSYTFDEAENIVTHEGRVIFRFTDWHVFTKKQVWRGDSLQAIVDEVSEFWFDDILHSQG